MVTSELHIAPEIPQKTESEELTGVIDVQGKLRTGRVLQTIVSVQEWDDTTNAAAASPELTFSLSSVSTAIEYNQLGQEIPIGKAVKTRIAGGTVPSGETSKIYPILVKATDDASPSGDKLSFKVYLEVVKD